MLQAQKNTPGFLSHWKWESITSNSKMIWIASLSLWENMLSKIWARVFLYESCSLKMTWIRDTFPSRSKLLVKPVLVNSFFDDSDVRCHWTNDILDIQCDQQWNGRKIQGFPGIFNTKFRVFLGVCPKLEILGWGWITDLNIYNATVVFNIAK